MGTPGLEAARKSSQRGVRKPLLMEKSRLPQTSVLISVGKRPKARFHLKANAGDNPYPDKQKLNKASKNAAITPRRFLEACLRVFSETAAVDFLFTTASQDRG